MLSKVLETPVDMMVELVKQNENCSITFLKNNLKISNEIIERWLIILEEYKILKVEYKGLDGYVKFNEIKNDKMKTFQLDKLKEKFIESSKDRKISYEKMKELWPIFIFENEKNIKEIFYEKSKELKYNDIKIKKAWEKYRENLEVF